jgi:hypothetical protein
MAVDLFNMLAEYDEGTPEHNRVAVELHRELGLKVWDEFVTDVDISDEPPPNTDPWRRASFERAVALRRLLVEATT